MQTADAQQTASSVMWSSRVKASRRQARAHLAGRQCWHFLLRSAFHFHKQIAKYAEAGVVLVVLDGVMAFLAPCQPQTVFVS